ncbi:hypothetical protein ACDU35_001001, partial [Neisseria gonorrhoeae]
FIEDGTLHCTSGWFRPFMIIAYSRVSAIAPPRRYGKTSIWRHKARYGGKPAFSKFYSYFIP